MLQFLHRENLWRELQTISRRRNSPLFVAAPFVGAIGGKLLRLKRDDVLVVALTLPNSRNGSVCPAEIRRLQKKGVKVYTTQDLHAKVLLCGRRAIVSSANLSQTSFDHLDEAGLLTTDATTVKKVSKWFDQRMINEVGPEWLNICEKAYKPPKGGMAQTGKRTRQHTRTGLWLLGIKFTEFPKDEEAVAEEGQIEAKRELADARKFEVFPVRWTGKTRFLSQIRKGDIIIPITKEHTARHVEEAALLLGTKKTKSRRGTPVTYLYLERRRRPNSVPWKAFKPHCASLGLKLGREVVSRELTNPVQAQQVLAIVPGTTKSQRLERAK